MGGAAAQAGITEKDWLCKCVVPVGKLQQEQTVG